MAATAHRASHRCASRNSRRLPQGGRDRSTSSGRSGATRAGKNQPEVTTDFGPPILLSTSNRDRVTSACEPYRELLEQGLGRGRNAMATLGYSWLDLLYVTILVFAVTRPASFLSTILRQRWLCWLGSIAYGTYLLHQGAQRLVFRLFSIDPLVVTGMYSLLITLAALALTLLVARISWSYFEKPLVRIGHRPDYKFMQDLPNSELAASQLLEIGNDQ
jgi:hypothetical protein